MSLPNEPKKETSTPSLDNPDATLADDPPENKDGSPRFCLSDKLRIMSTLASPNILTFFLTLSCCIYEKFSYFYYVFNKISIV